MHSVTKNLTAKPKVVTTQPVTRTSNWDTNRLRAVVDVEEMSLRLRLNVIDSMCICAFVSPPHAYLLQKICDNMQHVSHGRHLHPYCTTTTKLTKAVTTPLAMPTIGWQQTVQSRGVPHTHPRFASFWHPQLIGRRRRYLRPDLDAIIVYAISMHPHPR